MDYLRVFRVLFVSKHVRNLALASLVLSGATHSALRNTSFMPRWLRRGLRGAFTLWFFVFWYLYYWYFVVERPVILFQRSMWNMAIMERFRVRRFYPVFWGFNFHAVSAALSLAVRRAPRRD